MKCPKCQREMEKGYLHNAGQPVQWIPEDRTPSVWRAGVAADAIVFDGGSVFRGYRADAYYCPSCKMVIVPTEK